MKFYLKTVSAIVLTTALVYSGSALAGYGPAPAPMAHKPGNWTLSAGYGQTFGHKKTTFEGSYWDGDVDWKVDPTVVDGAKIYIISDSEGMSWALGEPNDDGMSQAWVYITDGGGWVQVDAYDPDGPQGSTMWNVPDYTGWYTPEDGGYHGPWDAEGSDLDNFKPDGLYSVVEEDYEATAKLEDLKIFEVDLFHSSGFGVVYMGTAEDGKLIAEEVGTAESEELSKYSFTGIFGAYKMAFGRDMSLRFGVGQTDQEYKDFGIKLDGEMAWNVEGKWNMPLGKSLNVFLAGGWLNQKEADLGWIKYDPSAGYWKVGVSFTM